MGWAGARRWHVYLSYWLLECVADVKYRRNVAVPEFLLPEFEETFQKSWLHFSQNTLVYYPDSWRSQLLKDKPGRPAADTHTPQARRKKAGCMECKDIPYETTFRSLEPLG